MTKHNRSRLLTAMTLVTLISAQLFGSLPAQAAQAAPLRAPASFLGDQQPLTGPIARYVGMGDSYAAGPLIPSTRFSNCIRSTNNFATWLAYNRGLVGYAGWMNAQFQDVACSATTTDAVEHPANFYQAGILPVDELPQLDVVTPSTDLVTITMGGNDESFFGTLISQCAELKVRAPEGSPCRDFYRTKDGSDQWNGTLSRTQDRLSTVIAAIKAKAAPGARILVVGYGTHLPDDGTTCDALDYAKGDYKYLNEQSIKLNQTVANAARSQRVGYVDTYTPTAGHTACDPNPWIRGGSTNVFAGVSNHPTKAGMIATADLIDQVLRGNVNAPQNGLNTPQNATLGEAPTAEQSAADQQIAEKISDDPAGALLTK